MQKSERSTLRGNVNAPFSYHAQAVRVSAKESLAYKLLWACWGIFCGLMIASLSVYVVKMWWQS